MKVEISNKLERLSDYVQELEELKELSPAELRNKPIKRAATERFFQMAIESVIDVCSMIISHEDLEKPDEYRKTITLLANAGILDEKFAENFSKLPLPKYSGSSVCRCRSRYPVSVSSKPFEGF